MFASFLIVITSIGILIDKNQWSFAYLGISKMAYIAKKLLSI